jgi:hypothetical protein
MVRYRNTKAERFGGDGNSYDIDYRQVIFAALNEHIQRIKYIASAEQVHACRNCKTTFGKWNPRCPQCDYISKTYHTAVEAIVFFESEQALRFCEFVEFDYDGYIEASKREFSEIDPTTQKLLLSGARRWWGLGMECENCERWLGDENNVKELSVMQSGEWIEVVLVCECGARYTDDIQIQHMER